MTQREQVLAAVVGGADTVREIQVVTGIKHGGTVRRELLGLEASGEVAPSRLRGSATLWMTPTYAGYQGHGDSSLP